MHFFLQGKEQHKNGKDIFFQYTEKKKEIGEKKINKKNQTEREDQK